MRVLLLLVGLLPSLQAVCLIHSCNRWISNAKANNVEFQNACAVVFDENCCKNSKDKYIIPKNTEGQFCRSRILGGGPSGCKGTKGIRDDIESLVVRPGCTLEVWKDGSGLTKAKAAERLGPQQGQVKHDRDMATKKKGRFIAVGEDLVMKDLDTAFSLFRSQTYDHLNEDVESFRCTCNHQSPVQNSGYAPQSSRPASYQPQSNFQPYGGYQQQVGNQQQAGYQQQRNQPQQQQGGYQPYGGIQQQGGYYSQQGNQPQRTPAYPQQSGYPSKQQRYQ